MLRFCFQYYYKNNANILFQFKLLLLFLGRLVEKFKSAATETTAVNESNGFCGPDSFFIQNRKYYYLRTMTGDGKARGITFVSI